MTLDDQLRSARSELSVLAQQHLAYPVLHLFDSSDPDVSSPLAVRRLDEVLTLLDAAEPDAVPPAPVRRQLRSSIARYTRTYGTRGHTASEAPPAPDLGPLRAAGIPLRVGTEQFQQMVDELGDHRGWVHSIVDPQGR